MNNNDNITINKKMLKEMGVKLCHIISAIGLGSSFTQIAILGYKTPMIAILTFALCAVGTCLVIVSYVRDIWHKYNPKKQEQQIL